MRKESFNLIVRALYEDARGQDVTSDDHTPRSEYTKAILSLRMVVDNDDEEDECNISLIQDTVQHVLSDYGTDA